MHQKHLPFTQQLPPDRFDDGHPLVVLADVGENRLAVSGVICGGRGRGCRTRLISDTAGDEQRGGRERVDVRLQLLDGCLVLDTEALLLVDDGRPRS